MLRWLCAVVVGAALSAFTFLLVVGHHPDEGPVLLTVSRNHGIHAGDLFVLTVWLLGMLALTGLTARGHQRQAARER